MDFFSRRIPLGWAAALLLPLFVLFVTTIPHSIQTNDTAELAANAWGLHLIHPPGYPLFQWLYHGFMKLMPVYTVFARAALMTALLGYLTAVSLATAAPLSSTLGLVLVAGFATSRLFWQYAILPDVFMLHLLICAAMIFVHFSEWSSRRRVYALGLFMGLGVANHHTIVFMSPLFLIAAWERRSWKDFAHSVLFAMLLAYALYASLFLIAGDHPLDWKPLHGFGDLWTHFTRADYGSFRLAREEGGANGASFGEVLAHFVHLAARSIPVLLAGALGGLLLTLQRVHASGRLDLKSRDSKFLALAGVLFIYVVVFFPLCNLPVEGALREVLERFFLMPMILLVAMGGWGWMAVADALRPSIRKVILGAAAVSVLWNLSAYRDLDYSEDKLIEDYVTDGLNRAGAAGKSVIFAPTDTFLFGAGYLQYVEGVHPEVPVVFLGGKTRPHLPEALRQIQPELKYESGEGSGGWLKFTQSNIGTFRIFTLLPMPLTGFQLRPLKAGYEILSDGLMPPVEDIMPTTERTPADAAIRFGGRMSLRVHDLRCAYDLALADRLYEAKRFSEALTSLNATLAKFPICFPAMERRCQLASEQAALGVTQADCDQAYQAMQEAYPEDYRDFSKP